MDKLEQIMNKQAELQRRLGTNFSELSDAECAEFMRNHRGYLADEIAEALYEMPHYKLWKDYSDMSEEQRAIAWQKVRMELIDSLHFFVNLLLCAGMTAEEVYEMYMAKNAENHRRQDAGYTSDVSYRDQNVEEVMGSEPMCATHLDGETSKSGEFIAVLVGDDGATTMHYNTNVVTFGMAIQMLSAHYTEMLKEYPEDIQDAIRASITMRTGEAVHG